MLKEKEQSNERDAGACAMEYRDFARFLPQRFPLLMVDKIVDYEPDRWIRGIKNVSGWEPLLVAPGAWEYPSGLIIESIGQLSIALFNISRSVEVPPDILLGSVSDVVLERRITTPCQLDIHAELVRELENGFVFCGEASVNGERVLSLGSLIAIENRTAGAP